MITAHSCIYHQNTTFGDTLNAYKGHTVRDQISFFASPDVIRRPAYTVLDRIDGMAPGEQMLATAVALVAMCGACHLDPHALITRANRLMKQADGPFTYHIKAIREYAANELLKRKN